MLRRNVFLLIFNSIQINLGYSWKPQKTVSNIKDFFSADALLDNENCRWVQVDQTFIDKFNQNIHDQDIYQRQVSESSSAVNTGNRKRSNLKRKYTKMEHVEIEEEHPMRTDEWMVDVNLSPFLFPPSVENEAQLFPESSNPWNTTTICMDGLAKTWRGKRRKRQVFKFSRNGCVLLSEKGDSNRITRIGRWHMDTHGISWVIPIRTTNNKNTVLHYHADIHLNKFQKRPRMFRGQVTRDRFMDIKFTDKICIPKYIFRPVVATFTAEGIGKDTVDTSYKNRGLGVGGSYSNN